MAVLTQKLIRRSFRDPDHNYYLFGPRGTGKSTWLSQAYPDALWIDLLSPAEQRIYAARPERLRELVAGQPAKPIVVVDEIQKVPALLDVVHALIEEGAAQRFVLTGSSARKLRRAGTNLLGGRARVRTLHPFMASELAAAFDFDRALEFGLLPLVWESEQPWDVLAAYAGMYLDEEVKMEGLVRQIGAFARFLEAISFSQSALLNLSSVARDCQVSRKTVEGYLSVLEDLLLCFLVPVFSRRAKRHLVAHRKFYWFDVGVFRSLRPRGPLDRPEEVAGAALEGLVAQHLRAWIEYGSRESSLSFWRTKSGNEVDFVVYGPDVFLAVEVKHSGAVRAADLRGLKAFREDYPEAHCALLYCGSERLEVDGIPCMPCDQFLRELVPGGSPF